MDYMSLLYFLNSFYLRNYSNLTHNILNIQNFEKNNYILAFFVFYCTVNRGYFPGFPAVPQNNFPWLLIKNDPFSLTKVLKKGSFSLTQDENRPIFPDQKR